MDGEGLTLSFPFLYRFLTYPLSEAAVESAICKVNKLLIADITKSQIVPRVSLLDEHISYSIESSITRWISRYYFRSKVTSSFTVECIKYHDKNFALYLWNYFWYSENLDNIVENILQGITFLKMKQLEQNHRLMGCVYAENYPAQGNILRTSLLF